MSNNNKTSTKLFFAALTLAGFSVFQGLKQSDLDEKRNQDAPVQGNKRKADEQLTSEAYADLLKGEVVKVKKGKNFSDSDEVAEMIATGKLAEKGKFAPKPVKKGPLSEAEYNKAFDDAVQKKQTENPNVNADDIKALVSAEFKVNGTTKAGAAKPKSLADQKVALEAEVNTLAGNPTLNRLHAQKQAELAVVTAQMSLEGLSGELNSSEKEALENVIKASQETLKQLKEQSAQAANAKGDDTIDVAQEAMTALAAPAYRLDVARHGVGVDINIFNNGLVAGGGMHYAIALAYYYANENAVGVTQRKLNIAHVSSAATQYANDMKRISLLPTATDEDRKAAKISQAILEVVNHTSARTK